MKHYCICTISDRIYQRQHWQPVWNFRLTDWACTSASCHPTRRANGKSWHYHSCFLLWRHEGTCSLFEFLWTNNLGLLPMHLIPAIIRILSLTFALSVWVPLKCWFVWGQWVCMQASVRFKSSVYLMHGAQLPLGLPLIMFALLSLLVIISTWLSLFFRYHCLNYHLIF